MSHFFNQALDFLCNNLKICFSIGDVHDETGPGSSEFEEFRIKVTITKTRVKYPRLNVDESYTLVMKPFKSDLVASIRAKTYFGARHALETLSQLIWRDHDNPGMTFIVLRKAAIQDSPKFPHRGLMLDTARQFFSIAAIKRVLVGMGASKLNVFHWHITDSQSFPFDSPSVPQMAKYGALSSEKVYSEQDVREVIEFARVRGIRVIIEIDTPAHAGNGWNWGPSYGYGELAVCVNIQPWNMYCGEPPCGQLNPENPKVYDVLEKIYKDVLDLSNDKELFHIGGDEVNIPCWDQFLPSRKNIEAPSFNYTFIDYHDIWGNFTLRAIKTLEKANKDLPIPGIIIWSSELTKKPYIDRYIDVNKVIVQSWGASSWPETQDLLSSGYRVILSHVDAWYLDCGFGKWHESGNDVCPPYKTWQTVYNHRPWHTLDYTADQKSHLLGGEACLWTEQTDEVSLDPKVWPRAAALAERLWSDPALGGAEDLLSVQEDVYTRLTTHRNRLVRRGLKPEAMWPFWCTQNPGQCL